MAFLLRTTVYTSTFPQDKSNTMAFLDNIDTPKIDAVAKDNLEEPIQLHKIVDFIGEMQNGKSPGPDD